MKAKYICPYCGQINENSDICSNCHYPMHLDLLNDQKCQDYFDMNIYINNNDFYKILDMSKKYSNNLYYEYFKMFSSICLGKEYDTNDFFKHKYEYTEKELRYVCYHMLEKRKLYDQEQIILFLNTYDYKEKNALITYINSEQNEQVLEKDLREELFSLTKTLPVNEKAKHFKHGSLYLLLLSLILLVIFTVVALITTEKELQYEMLIVALIIPTIFFSKAFMKIVFKKKNIIINIIVFLVLYYLITYLITLPFHNFDFISLYEHLKRIIYTPFVLVKTMHERMN